MLKLHDYVLSAECYAVRLMLSLLHLQWQTIAVDAYPGNGMTAHGEIPVLEHEGTVLTDPGLILAYLARRSDPAGTWLPAADGAAVSTWLAFAATDLAALRTARKVSILGEPGDLDALNVAGRAALRRIEDELTIATLEGRDWLVAETPTIADIAVFPAVALSHDSGIGHEDYPAINLWQRRVRRLPGFVGMPGIPDYF